MERELQKQFQIFYQSHLNSLSTLSPEQSFEVNRLLNKNSELLQSSNCYLEQGHEVNQLGVIMAVVKLQLLQFRMSYSKKEFDRSALALKQLKLMMEAFLSKPSQQARRLGASIRRLYLDELENLVSFNSALVQELMQETDWSMEASRGIELEINALWQDLSHPFSLAPLSPEGLARYFGRRPWKTYKKGKMPVSKWVSRFSDTSDSTLELQLLKLFKTHSATLDFDNPNFHFSETNLHVQHYLALAINELKKDNYFSLQKWLEPLLKEKVKKLQEELGPAWPLIYPLAGKNVAGDFQKITYPIELLSQKEFSRAEKNYSQVKNPLGRLYEIIVLNELMQAWTVEDILQLRQDYDRVIAIKTLLAIQSYEKVKSRWPMSLHDLVQTKFLPTLPRDHFLGKELKMNSLHKQVWSTGQNGVDENGNGDDIGVQIKL